MAKKITERSMIPLKWVFVLIGLFCTIAGSAVTHSFGVAKWSTKIEDRMGSLEKKSAELSAMIEELQKMNNKLSHIQGQIDILIRDNMGVSYHQKSTVKL